MSENYALQLRHITKTFPGVKALNDVSFDVRYGTVHSIVGERRGKVYADEDHQRHAYAQQR